MGIVNTCEPCECLGGTVDNESFKAAVLSILCMIAGQDASSTASNAVVGHFVDSGVGGVSVGALYVKIEVTGASDVTIEGVTHSNGSVFEVQAVKDENTGRIKSLPAIDWVATGSEVRVTVVS